MILQGRLVLGGDKSSYLLKDLNLDTVIISKWGCRFPMCVCVCVLVGHLSV